MHSVVTLGLVSILVMASPHLVLTSTDRLLESSNLACKTLLSFHAVVKVFKRTLTINYAHGLSCVLQGFIHKHLYASNHFSEFTKMVAIIRFKFRNRFQLLLFLFIRHPTRIYTLHCLDVRRALIIKIKIVHY